MSVSCTNAKSSVQITQKSYWGQIFTKVTVWHDRSMEYNWVFYWVESLRISKSHTSMHIWSSLFKFWGIFYPTIRFGYLGRINQECHCVTVKPAPFFRFLISIRWELKDKNMLVIPYSLMGSAQIKKAYLSNISRN